MKISNINIHIAFIILLSLFCIESCQNEILETKETSSVGNNTNADTIDIYNGIPFIRMNLPKINDVKIGGRSVAENTFNDICLIHTHNSKFVAKDYISNLESQALQHKGDGTLFHDFKILSYEPKVGDTTYIIANLGLTDSQYDALLPSIGSQLSLPIIHDMFLVNTLTYKQADDNSLLSGIAAWHNDIVAYSTMKYAFAKITVDFADTLSLSPFLLAPTTHIYFQVQNDAKEGCLFPLDKSLCSHGGFFENESHYTDGTKGTPMGDTVYAWETPVQRTGIFQRICGERYTYPYTFWSGRICIIVSIYDDLRPSYQKHLRFDFCNYDFDFSYFCYNGEDSDKVTFYNIARSNLYDFKITDIDNIDDIEQELPSETARGSVGYNSFKDAYYYPPAHLRWAKNQSELNAGDMNGGTAFGYLSNFAYDISFNYDEYQIYSNKEDFDLGVFETELNCKFKERYDTIFIRSDESVLPTISFAKVAWSHQDLNDIYQATAYPLGYESHKIHFSGAPVGITTTYLDIYVGNLMTTIKIVRHPAVSASGGSFLHNVVNATITNRSEENLFGWGRTNADLSYNIISNNLGNEGVYLNIRPNSFGELVNYQSTGTSMNDEVKHLDKILFYVDQLPSSGPT